MAPRLVGVAHGSRSDRSVPALEALLERVRPLLPETPVQLAFVDHRTPSVSAALRETQEPTVVVPLLLSAASHVKGDVAAAVRASGPQVVQARPLIPHIGVVHAVAQRLDEAGVGPSDPVILAAIGSADPDANAMVAADARRLWEWRGGTADVEAGFASATHPRVSEAADRLRRLGHDRITIATYALAPGFLLESAIEPAGAAVVTEPLADTDAMAQVVAERYTEACTRDIRMGCDTCIYRVAWPGYEHQVGTVQRVHPHPDDA